MASGKKKNIINYGIDVDLELNINGKTAATTIKTEENDVEEVDRITLEEEPNNKGKKDGVPDVIASI